MPIKISTETIALLDSVTETLAPADQRNLAAWEACGFVARAAAKMLSIHEVNISNNKAALKKACIVRGLGVSSD